MNKLFAAALIVSLVFILAGKPARATFNDVVIDGQVIEIEASGKSNYTTCRYFTDDYLAYLGAYDAPVATTDLLAFCVDHFEERN